MTRRRKLLALAAILSLLSITAFYLVLSRFFEPERFRAFVKDSLQASWKGKVEVGSAGVSFPPAVTIEDVSLLDPAGKRVLAHLDSFDLVPSLGKLLSFELAVEKIRMSKPVVDLARDDTGAILLVSLLRGSGGDETGEKRDGGRGSDRSTGGGKGDDRKAGQGEGAKSSGIPGISLDSVEVDSLVVKLPSTGGDVVTFGPFSGDFAVRLDRALACIGGISGVPGMKSGPLGIGGSRLDIEFVKDRLNLDLRLDDLSLERDEGAVDLGSLHLSVERKKDGRIDGKARLEHPGGKGSAELHFVSNGSTVSGKLSASDLALHRIVPAVGSAFELNEQSRGALEISRFGVKLVLDEEGILRLEKGEGSFGNGAAFTLVGRIGGDSYRAESTLRSYALYPLLSGRLAAYEFGPGIEKLALGKLTAILESGRLTVQDLVLTVASGSTVRASFGLAMSAEGLPFTKASQVSPRIDGRDVIDLLKVDPVNKLDGVLEGKLALGGGALSPRLSGKLSSTKLVYTYAGTPAVPLHRVEAALDYSDLVLRLNSLTGKIFGGDLSASGVLDLTVTPFKYSWTLDSVEVHLEEMVKPVPLLASHVKGILRASSKGNGSGTALSALSADGRIAAQGLAITDASSLLLPALAGGKSAVTAAKASLGRLLDKPGLKDLSIGKLDSVIHLSKGAVTLSDVKTSGPVGLQTGGLAYDLQKGLLRGKITLALPSGKGAMLPVPVSISGSLTSPRLTIDSQALKRHLGESLASSLASKLSGGKLGKKLDLKAGDGASLSKAAAKAKDETRNKLEDKLKDKIDKKLGKGTANLLRGLFR